MLSITDYKRKYIVTNFAYGTGPFLRTTNLAIAFNREYQRLTGTRMGIIVPWLYGERQKKVMLEEFSGHQKKFPGEILLDNQLGNLYRRVFYGVHDYAEALKLWVDETLLVSREALHYLQGDLSVETLTGEKKVINGKNIAVELNRSPRIKYGVAPSYFTSFASLEEILRSAKKIKGFVVPSRLLSQAIMIANEVERDHQSYALSYPGTFSFKPDLKDHFPNQILVPPIAPPPKLSNNKKIQEGIFVTVTGIPGLERLYREANELGLRLYSNDPLAVPGSCHALPQIIPNKNIKLQFARSGWSSVWISMIAGTPLVVPDYDPTDDPEIYFNNQCIEKLGIGIVYRGQSLREILRQAKTVQINCQRLTEKIKKRFGTLDGNMYCATLFANDFLKKFK